MAPHGADANGHQNRARALAENQIQTVSSAESSASSCVHSARPRSYSVHTITSKLNWESS